eukprot:GHVU01188868.1.p1 GENE.GHVU01188868.1~~GHVU01188868.1.p1  ORF type:complete len:281 (+),score=35.14 GHVU01188868.1:71-913(+)
MWRRLFCFPRAAAAVVATSAAAFVVDPWVGGARKEEENGTSTGFFSRKIGRLPTSPMEPWWRFTPQHDGQRAGRWFPFARMLADPAAASSSEEEQQTTSGVLPWSSGARRWRSLQQCESAADCGDQSGESAAELLLPARTRRTNAEETLENTAAVERKHDDDEGTTLVTPDFSKLFEKLRPSVCGVYHYRADHAGPRFRFVGSGFIYRPNGKRVGAWMDMSESAATAPVHECASACMCVHAHVCGCMCVRVCLRACVHLYACTYGGGEYPYKPDEILKGS